MKSTSYDFNSKDLKYNNQEIISIREYADLKFNGKGLDPKTLTRLPRGAKVVSQKSFRTGFEIKFEWEEETKED